ncbi:hypothetical protein AB205_0198050 [Aquarana catesbeiana]|uniref:Uncharacterized protein n=1 Tax=Aquarana catesbeiana TaxID=8400 RepID=A0A2G9RS34_AQUCT|nr:hypothetical protein AB205_0198050 [Aquarana catesbeiana]
MPYIQHTLPCPVSAPERRNLLSRKAECILLGRCGASLLHSFASKKTEEAVKAKHVGLCVSLGLCIPSFYVFVSYEFDQCFTLLVLRGHTTYWR